MGSWFSSPDRPRYVIHHLGQQLKDAAYTEEVSEDAYCIRDLASEALKHYNSNHPGAEFLFPAQRTMATYACVVCPPTKDMKGASVGFRRNLWYHVNFVARPWKGDGHDERTFFAELCYDNSSHRLIVQTCTILEEKPSRSSCAMCPEESKILHPDDAEFVCGKQGHEREFFSEWSWDGHTKEFFSQSAMLSTPFLLGGQTPRYRLPDE